MARSDPARLVVSGEPPELTDADLAAIAARPGRSARLAQGLVHNPALVAGLLLLGGFSVVALAELWVWGPAVGTLQVNYAWVNGLYPPGPSWAHPFGVMRGI